MPRSCFAVLVCLVLVSKTADSWTESVKYSWCRELHKLNTSLFIYVESLYLQERKTNEQELEKKKQELKKMEEDHIRYTHLSPYLSVIMYVFFNEQLGM